MTQEVADAVEGDLSQEEKLVFVADWRVADDSALRGLTGSVAIAPAGGALSCAAPSWSVDGAMADHCCSARQRPHWGPRKLRAVLMGERPEAVWPAASTMGDLLRAEGLLSAPAAGVVG